MIPFMKVDCWPEGRSSSRSESVQRDLAQQHCFFYSELASLIYRVNVGKCTNVYMYMYLYVYICVYICIHIYIYIYIHIFIYYVLCIVYYVLRIIFYRLIQITKKWSSPCQISLHWFGSWIWPACWPTAGTKFSKRDPNDSVHESWLLDRRQVKFKIRISAKRFGATALLFL